MATNATDQWFTLKQVPNSGVFVCVGLRRSGKSTLAATLLQALVRRHPTNQVVLAGQDAAGLADAQFLGHVKVNALTSDIVSDNEPGRSKASDIPQELYALVWQPPEPQDCDQGQSPEKQGCTVLLDGSDLAFHDPNFRTVLDVIFHVAQAENTIVIVVLDETQRLSPLQLDNVTLLFAFPSSDPKLRQHTKSNFGVTLFPDNPTSIDWEQLHQMQNAYECLATKIRRRHTVMPRILFRCDAQSLTI